MTVREIKQAELSAECWNIQMFGESTCNTCEFRGKRDCGGKKIRKTGKNENGFTVPLGKES